MWQERFWEHQIRDDADDARHVDYVHYNPVKHGLVAEALIGRIQRFIVTSGSVFIHRIGQVPRCHEPKAAMGNRTDYACCFTSIGVYTSNTRLS